MLDSKKDPRFYKRESFPTKIKKVRKAGLEPARYCYHRHLKPARLPIPPLPHHSYIYTTGFCGCQQYFLIFFIFFVFFLRFRQLTVFDPISIQVSDIKDRFLFSDIYLTESRMHFLFTLFLSLKRKESSISIELSYAVDGT